MIDLRSDTVTQPTEGMHLAMQTAPLGDDVYGEDPTINELEAHAAELLGKEAALFVTSGTQSNLCALLAHCERGDEYLVGQSAHCYRWEGGGAAVLGSIQPQPIEMGQDGTMALDDIERYVKPTPNMHHFARTRLLCLENTKDGAPLPRGYVADAVALARRHGLATHLDGARLWNAVVADGVSPAEAADGFDTVSVCLSKGLGAPMGSVLVGDRARIDEARRWRKMLGGGTRQGGVVAAAGLYALRNHIDRLADDHANAARLAAGLGEIPGVTVTARNTNMTFLEIDDSIDTDRLQADLAERGVQVFAGPTMRLVCHLDVTEDDVDTVIDGFADVLTRAAA